MMRYTRTRTYFFNADDIKPLRDAADALREDYEHRREAISEDIRLAFEHRLRLLHSAIFLLGEPVE